MPFIWVKIFKTEKTIEIQEVRLTEVCGKVLSEKNAYKSVKTALLLSNGFDADHQNSCLFTNKGHFSSPIIMGFNWCSRPIALTRLLELDSWVTLRVEPTFCFRHRLPMKEIGPLFGGHDDLPVLSYCI